MPAADRLYAAIVTQSRQPVFFRELGVMDDPDGRFDMLALHLALLLLRLKAEGKTSELLARSLLERFVDDMDLNLRELGAGDLGVARRVRFMAGALKGRLQAYEEGLEKGDIAPALRRNLYRERLAADDTRLLRMNRYVQATARVLADQEMAVMATGKIAFAGLA
jgi:cytochrome b pre-mRNA-processing protein 3